MDRKRLFLEEFLPYNSIPNFIFDDSPQGEDFMEPGMCILTAGGSKKLAIAGEPPSAPSFSGYFISMIDIDAVSQTQDPGSLTINEYELDVNETINRISGLASNPANNNGVGPSSILISEFETGQSRRSRVLEFSIDELVSGSFSGYNSIQLQDAAGTQAAGVSSDIAFWDGNLVRASDSDPVQLLRFDMSNLVPSTGVRGNPYTLSASEGGTISRLGKVAGLSHSNSDDQLIAISRKENQAGVDQQVVFIRRSDFDVAATAKADQAFVEQSLIPNLMTQSGGQVQNPLFGAIAFDENPPGGQASVTVNDLQAGSGTTTKSASHQVFLADNANQMILRGVFIDV